MSASFSKNLKVVTGIHVAVLCVLLSSGWLKGRAKPEKNPEIIPLEFMVEVPAAEIAPPPVHSIPDPAPVNDPVKPPPPKPRKEPIKISDRVIRNPNLKRPDVKPPSPEEIEKLLAMGAKPGHKTVIPDDDSIHFGKVHRAFYNAWSQPSADEVGDSQVEAEVSFALDGTVTGARISKSSGVRALDDSVRKALGYVKRVSGLTRDFLSRHRTISISFKVE